MKTFHTLVDTEGRKFRAEVEVLDTGKIARTLYRRARDRLGQPVYALDKGVRMTLTPVEESGK